MEDYLIPDKSEGKVAGEFLTTMLETLKIQQKQFAGYLNLIFRT
ncbi:hypothetical protein [Mariniphaga sediminis]